MVLIAGRFSTALIGCSNLEEILDNFSSVFAGVSLMSDRNQSNHRLSDRVPARALFLRPVLPCFWVCRPEVQDQPIAGYVISFLQPSISAHHQSFRLGCSAFRRLLGSWLREGMPDNEVLSKSKSGTYCQQGGMAARCSKIRQVVEET